MNYTNRNIFKSVLNTLAAIAFLGSVIFGLKHISEQRNDKKQDTCLTSGGEYYRANWSGFSICKMVGKTV